MGPSSFSKAALCLPILEKSLFTPTPTHQISLRVKNIALYYVQLVSVAMVPFFKSLAKGSDEAFHLSP